MFTVSGLLRADGGSDTIENFSTAGDFTNDGELQVSNAGTVLTLKNDQLQDFIGSQGGYIQVVGTGNGTGVTASNSATLDLTGNTTIDGGGTLTNPAMFTVSGLLETTAAATTIENFSTAGGFTNDGELLVSSGTVLTLNNDQLEISSAARAAISRLTAPARTGVTASNSARWI